MKYLNLIPFIVGGASAAVLCASNKGNTAPGPVPNTLEGFKNESLYTFVSRDSKSIPGYEAVTYGADCAIASSKYMTYVALKEYDPKTCADKCDAHAGCDAFNIYIQREPGVQPSHWCPNPTAIAVTKCALYSEPVTKSQCTNEGQRIGPVDRHNRAFEVAIRGSNAYNKLPAKKIIQFLTVTKYLSAAVPTPSTPSSLLTIRSNTRIITREKEEAASPTSTLYGPRVTPHTPDRASNIDSHGRTFSSRTVTATIDDVVRIDETREVYFPEVAPISTDGPFPHGYWEYSTPGWQPTPRWTPNSRQPTQTPSA
ncbi:hypothetical protein CFE70_003075 [Pyrenophora teres f. teres 0-1]|uniref:Apple domain-containing protein n=2 Tax=Pyrenophora teres f. teres TaxID=97479 RepID=E3RQM1_PYRTT|nr:hypothetical protein PTT_11038 [Pyrenophora teres f. teres 0-1]KAE8846442.1 hypothetical protein HRS9139_01009 [Pyrenophora teres f. teres]KAE8848582.1 hypothetical protein PTNB85_02425 [Pyrenophora teres f. teres]KAE8853249.1 hypothetical protein HRS9122_00241 [Pyrenophora teres f. teres]KAE8868508.1 hypothetical protein PTNB29_02419 [Pyrenophora teres f. teres]